MASLHECNNIVPKPPATCTRPFSVHAAFAVAGLVYCFKDRLKSRVDARHIPVKDCQIAVKRSLEYSFRNHLRSYSGSRRYREIYARKEICQRDNRLRFLSAHGGTKFITEGQNRTGVCRTRIRAYDSCPLLHVTDRCHVLIKLLDDLDMVVKPQGVVTAVVATRDELFLQYDAQDLLRHKGIEEIRPICELARLLIARLRQMSNTESDENSSIAEETTHLIGLRCPRTLANLEHMIFCLQQAALEALICCSIKLLETDRVRWHQYWKQRRHSTEEWFTEWPSGRRPLSTTWPWNIKPALVILWGVCWMFYDDSTRTGTWDQAAGFPNFRTGQLPRTAPEVCTGSAYSITGIAPTNPWWQVSQAEDDSRRVSKRITDYYSLPASTASLPSTAYIFASPSTSSASFATAPGFLPHYQGIDNLSSSPYDSNRTLAINQHQQSEELAIQAPINPNVDTPTAVYPYVPPSTPTFAYEAGRAFAGQSASTGLPVNSLALRSSSMPGYPSPRSQMSVSSRSPSLSVYPTADVSPRVPYTTIPAKRSSTYGSPQSAKSEEPARNDQGQLYCPHSECSSKPPTFTRKCEWTKHMDKHNRPYVCTERGCEKILGFTYSGGLLRHRREVHKKDGGPKASYMCPHKDCNRSTGNGFSRKENLNEHLRRRHRGVEEDEKAVQSSKPEGRNSRKRRRESSPDEQDQEAPAPDANKRRKAEENDQSAPVEGSEQDSGDLRAQVLYLQQELQQRDERLRKLEETVAKLTGG